MSKLLRSFCYIGFLVTCGVLSASSQSSTPPNKAGHKLQRITAYTATEWATLTQPLPDGTTNTAVRRTEVSRDASGRWTRAIYRSTSGPQYDTSAALDHVNTGLTVNIYKSLAPALAAGEVLEQDEDLGTRIESGLTTYGRRRTFASTLQQSPTRHTLITWYAPSLGVIMHSESQNLGGSKLTVDLTNLQLGSAGTVQASVNSSSDAPAPQDARLDLRLYRALFSIVTHMEQARAAELQSSTHHMAEAEESLRKDLKLSQTDWQTLVKTSVTVDSYVEENRRQAQAVAREGRGASQQSPPDSTVAKRALSLLQRLQADKDSKVVQDVQKLEAAIGDTSTATIRAFLHGPLAASAHRVKVKARSQVAQ